MKSEAVVDVGLRARSVHRPLKFGQCAADCRRGQDSGRNHRSSELHKSGDIAVPDMGHAEDGLHRDIVAGDVEVGRPVERDGIEEIVNRHGHAIVGLRGQSGVGLGVLRVGDDGVLVNRDLPPHIVVGIDLVLAVFGGHANGRVDVVAVLGIRDRGFAICALDDRVDFVGIVNAVGDGLCLTDFRPSVHIVKARHLLEGVVSKARSLVLHDIAQPLVGDRVGVLVKGRNGMGFLA